MLSINRFNPFRRFASWRLWLRGWRDGRAGIPAYEAADQPPVLEEVREAGSNDVAREAKRWTQRDARLRTAWADAVHQLRHAASALTRAEQQHEAARRRYAEANGEAPPATADRRNRSYWVVFAVLALVELPVNAAAFQAIGDKVYATVGLAVLVGVVLLGGAHIVGIKLRQTRRWTWQARVETLACVLGPVGIIATIGYFRSLYMQAHSEQLIAAGIDLDPALVTLAFVAVNAAAYLFGAALSSWAHPKGWGELIRTRRRLRAARAHAEQAERAVEQARIARMEAYEAVCTYADHIQESVDLGVERYRQANLLHRRDRDQHEQPYPASFRTPVTIGRPAALDRLDWTLPDAAAMPRPLLLGRTVAGDGAGTTLPDHPAHAS